MTRPYHSFLVRFWRLGQAQRFEVEHIQSGQKILLASLADMAEWIGDCAGEGIRVQRDEGDDFAEPASDSSSLVESRTPGCE